MSTSLTRWVANHVEIASGAFASAVFLLVGVAGVAAVAPDYRAWYQSRSWPTTEAEITDARLIHAIGTRLSRAEFTYRYIWKGQQRTTSGYALINAYITTSLMRSRLADHPIGSRTTIIVNPDRPEQAFLVRSDVAGLFQYVIPPVFALLGLIGTFFTTAGWLGWLDPKSRHPVGRATRAMGRVFLRESVLKGILYLVMFGVIGGLIVGGIMAGNVVVVFAGIVMLWFFWKASRVPKQ